MTICKIIKTFLDLCKNEVDSCLCGSDDFLRNRHACARLPSVWCRHHRLTFFFFISLSSSPNTLLHFCKLSSTFHPDDDDDDLKHSHAEDYPMMERLPAASSPMLRRCKTVISIKNCHNHHHQHRHRLDHLCLSPIIPLALLNLLQHRS